MVQIGSNCIKLDQKGLNEINWIKLDQTGSNWIKSAQRGTNQSFFLKMGPKTKIIFQDLTKKNILGYLEIYLFGAMFNNVQHFIFA